MAHIYGNRLKRNIQVHKVNLMALFIFLAYAIFLLWAYLKSGNYLIITALWIPILCFGVILAKKYFFFEKTIAKGIKLENVVLKNLSKLPGTFAVMQHIDVGHEAGDIDFVAIGPKGIFAIETKSQGFNQNAEKELLNKTLTLQDLISVHTGHTVFIEPILIRAKKTHQYSSHKIKVLNKEEISKYILFQQDSLSQKECMKIEGEVFKHIKKSSI